MPSLSPRCLQHLHEGVTGRQHTLSLFVADWRYSLYKLGSGLRQHQAGKASPGQAAPPRRIPASAREHLQCDAILENILFGMRNLAWAVPLTAAPRHPG
jgi:hypothetical protein